MHYSCSMQWKKGVFDVLLRDYYGPVWLLLIYVGCKCACILLVVAIVSCCQDHGDFCMFFCGFFWFMQEIWLLIVLEFLSLMNFRYNIDLQKISFLVV